MPCVGICYERSPVKPGMTIVEEARRRRCGSAYLKDRCHARLARASVSMVILLHMRKKFYVYIVTNKKEGIFYTGVTSSLAKRIWGHKNKVVNGFSKKYNLDKLVYYEVFEDAENALRREKRLKRWGRDWKIEAIEKFNPKWDDLYNNVVS